MSMFLHISTRRTPTDFGRVILAEKKLEKVIRTMSRTYAVRAERPITQTEIGAVIDITGRREYALSRFVPVRYAAA